MSDESIDEARKREQDALQNLREAEAEAREHLEEDEQLEEDAPDVPEPPPSDED
jgi:hypothetical protein